MAPATPSLQRRHRLPLHPRRGRTGGIGYELLGRRVVALADRLFATGQHNLRWHGADDQGQTLASGADDEANVIGVGRQVISKD